MLFDKFNEEFIDNLIKENKELKEKNEIYYKDNQQLIATMCNDMVFHDELDELENEIKELKLNQCKCFTNKERNE